MSEEATSAPPVTTENGEKSAEEETTKKEDETTQKMSEVKISEAAEGEGGEPVEAEARENGDDGFHTPEATDEGTKEVADGSVKLDDDEIEDNPAYIPRKGRYYMHDSRDADEEVEEEKKISRADGTWKHDRFDERWQRPKTKKQIMTRYGFDIREGETQEEAEQRKRSEDGKKEAVRDGEPTGVKRRLKREVRQKPRQRTERTNETVSKQPTRRSGTQKPERQAAEEKSSQGNSDERVANDRRVNNDDDDDLHVGQRRQVRPEHRRDRNERVDVRVVRNVRGSRGSMGVHRMDRHQPLRERHDKDREADTDRYRKDRHVEERGYENHRRGAMRGAVRGAGNSYVASRGLSMRTITASARTGDVREPTYQRDEAPPQRNAGYSPRALDSGSYYDTRGGYGTRGGYAGRSRGGLPQSPRGTYAEPYPPRGFTGPKRYSEQRGEILPPPAPITVPPPLPPPQHNFSIPRQPTDVVYFDPTQQPSRQPLPPREKKIIEIVPPSK